MVKGRPTYYWAPKPVPTQDCSFGLLPRDLAARVFCNIEDLHVLLLLKAVSKATANCVRHVLHLTEKGHTDVYDEYDSSDDWYGDLCLCISNCSLSFPMRVVYHHKPNAHCDLGTTGLVSSGVELIVHELEAEFRGKNDAIMTKGEIIEWINACRAYAFGKTYGGYFSNREHEDILDIHSSTVRFVVEWPGVGVFHSCASLLDKLDLSKYQNGLIYGANRTKKNPGYNDVLFVGHSQELIELLSRTFPVVKMGNFMFTVDLNETDSSLLHHFLWDRLVA